MSTWLYTMLGFFGGCLVTIIGFLIITYNMTMKKGKE